MRRRGSAMQDVEPRCDKVAKKRSAAKRPRRTDPAAKRLAAKRLRRNVIDPSANEILKDFDKAQLRVEMMPGSVLTDEENDNERDSFERRYCDVASKIYSLIQKIQNEEQEIIAGTPLPPINPPDLGDSHAGVVKPFRSLESEPNKQQQFKKQNSNFRISGVDYLGPILIKESTDRGKRNVKAYVSIFICLVTKAVHLELVGNLTTESFLGALHRLIARRGHVRHLYSDNGSNFTGAANQKAQKFFRISVRCKLTKRNTEFHFIPARSPHMGGLIIGLATPTFEEMYTLLTRIEAILNSRPFTSISNDPNDLEPLTPGRFLSPGESLTAVHEGDLTEDASTLLAKMDSRLQARSKWRNPDTTPAVGSLVLIADDDLPPLCWNLAHITELHFGKDGVTESGVVKNEKRQRAKPEGYKAPREK
ncbi:hypothetical protein GEV33_001501 [Tenebrio molitor]|uniref:DUF5641 domain-containing protein n=1 Tax=Tenebrio molitor TaxID=7067 RepID=A0A8J6HM59_TENMO|nr:hypothetical protein GEV33_001501 [Tenebrio molitor]